MTNPAPRFLKTLRLFREPFNGISHLAGAALSVAALVVLLILAWGRPWATAAFTVYGVSLIVLYAASTLYHSLRVSRRVYHWLGRCDYIAIFLLIAGTYAPLCLVTLRHTVGWPLMLSEYGLALMGIAGVVFWKRMPDWVRIVLYVVMGCLIVPVLPHLSALLPPAALGWLVAGGIVYLIGLMVFTLDRPTLWPGRNIAHGLWHLFVLGGSACHYILVLRYIALPV